MMTMQNKPRTPASPNAPASNERSTGRHGLSESQDPQAAARRAKRISDERTSKAETSDADRGEHEVRLRSNYQTTPGDVAAAADANADGRGDSASAPR
jgi:hypothetical protein